jgi:hypothetical protein
MNQETTQIFKNFEVEIPEEEINEEQMINMLADRIAYMLEYQLEYLFSMMYRMDVSEKKVSEALHPMAEEPANVGLARLVIERQKERLFTKEHYKQVDLGDEEDLRW